MKITKERKLKSFIFIMDSNEKKYISDKYIYSKENEFPIHHTNIANFKKIKSAGCIYFSEDLKEIICVANRSRNYTQNINS